MRSFSTQIPTHLLVGSLGSGKTTLLGQLLARQPKGEKWAVLINEFGQIGLDAALLAADPDAQIADFAIKEVAGGCMCCSTRLPLEIALIRLLKEVKPDRLWIEPSGLADPEALIEQFTASQWQSRLALRAIVGVVDARQLLDPSILPPGAKRALQYADLIYLSHADQSLNLPDLNDEQPRLQLAQTDEALWRQLNQPHVLPTRQYRPLLAVAQLNLGQTLELSAQADSPPDLPFFYIEHALEHTVIGWQLPADWQFDDIRLLDWLMSLQEWQRIKGVLHGTLQWLTLNLIPGQVQFKSAQDALDNRLEMIWPDTLTADQIAALEAGLMACRC